MNFSYIYWSQGMYGKSFEKKSAAEKVSGTVGLFLGSVSKAPGSISTEIRAVEPPYDGLEGY